MAKKPAAKKTAKKAAKKTAKKTARKVVKKAARKSTASKAQEAAKPAPRKSTASKKSASKKSAAKKTEAMSNTTQATPAEKKTAKKKPVAKKSAAKTASKKTSKKTASKATSKPAKSAAEAKPEGADAATKKTSKKSSKAADKPTAKKPAAPKGKAGEKKTETADDKKSGRKGITIVQPAKKPSSRGKAVSKHIPPVRPMLLGPGSKITKPLIPSGPSAPKPESTLDSPKSRRTKSPLTKAKLEKFRQLLLSKRAELLGDVESMENEALRSESGGLSNNPQHIAEQGSENYDQTLSLNLAAQDRKRIKEIDDALGRIEQGTYGLCELTNLPIPEERLEELPWARYTIEAARQLERNWGPSS